MNERFLNFYEQEKAFISEEILEYGHRFPKIQTRLDAGEDPHVARLIDAFALLNARLRLKIDDEFPEVCQSLMQALYPQYVAPVPSMAICRLALKDVGADLVAGYDVPANTTLETEQIDGLTSCIYRTCAPTKIFPIRIKKIEYLKPPFRFATESSWADQSNAALRIEFEGLSAKLDWSTLKIDTLRFYLGGLDSCANKLLETLLRDSLVVGLFSDRTPRGVFVDRSTLSHGGFATEDAILTPDPRTIPSYHLLWEYFALPEKFRFVSLNLGEAWNEVAGKNFAIVVFLDRHHQLIANQISFNPKAPTRDSIQLGCVPVVNLFPFDPQPIRLTETRTDYQVRPSENLGLAYEVHSIQHVHATCANKKEPRNYLPFFAQSHRLESNSSQRYWQAIRKSSLARDNGDRGSEVFISLVDLSPAHPNSANAEAQLSGWTNRLNASPRPKPNEEWTLHLSTLCCNRDLVSKLTANSELYCHIGPISAAFASSPTRTRRPLMHDDWVWRIISHLSLNHLSLMNEERGPEMLRELLRLYICADDESEMGVKHKAIEGLLSIEYHRKTARIDDGGKGTGICRGLEILMSVDEEQLEPMGVYLFASILDQFFSLYASINSFTRLKVYNKTRAYLIYDGRARSGSKFLI